MSLANFLSRNVTPFLPGEVASGGGVPPAGAQSSLADFFDRIGTNFSNNISDAGPMGLASLGAAIASAPRNQWGSAIAQGLGGMTQMAQAERKKRTLADALQGAMGDLTPQQKAFLGAVEPEQQMQLLGPHLFKEKNQPSGPFQGHGMESSSANIIVRGQTDPALRASPEYAIAYSSLTTPRVITDAEGRQMLYRPEVPKGIQPPTSGQMAAPVPSPVPMPRPPQPAPSATPAAPAPGPLQMAEMEAAPQSTAPVVSAVPGGGTTTPIPGTGKTPTEAQLKAGDYFARMAGSEATLSDEKARNLYMDFWNMAARQGGDWTEFRQGPEAQTYKTAASEFIAALLRKDTGAAVTPQEFAFYSPLYIPEYGDKPERLAYKAAARARAREAIKAGLTPDQIVKLEKVVADTPNPSLEKKYPAPPPEAISRLKMARDKAAFDEVFGPGAADKYLGGK